TWGREFVLNRYVKSTGALDGDFGRGGRITIDRRATGLELVTFLTEHVDGKPVVGGSNGTDFVLARYVGGLAGGVLVQDRFEDADSGVLPAQSTTAGIAAGYEGGGDPITEKGPSLRLATPTIDGIYADTTLSLDARIAGELANRFINLQCRSDGQGGTYSLRIFPADGRVDLVAGLPGGAATTLFDQVVPAAAFGSRAGR